MNDNIINTGKTARKGRLSTVWSNVKRDKILLLMFLPFFLYYIIFKYIPITGIALSFLDSKPGTGLFAGEWVGFKWFSLFFQSPYAFRLIRNTVLLSFYSLVFGFPIPILFAICVTEIRNIRARRIVQTVSYLPYFISTVVLVGMINNFFSLNNGIVNLLIEKIGGASINFLNDPNYFRSLYVGSGIWQGFGFNSIIYIAAITGIDPALYEAAEIDGISKFKAVIHITLPMITTTLIILFIMQLGSLMSVGFEKVFLLYSPAVYETADVISTYVYRKGISASDYNFATAVGLFNSVINFAFVFSANKITRKVAGTSLW